jgi:hypothetical protein
VAAHSLCRECGGTGWIPYYSKTVYGKLEEAYHLCPNRCAPCCCMGSKTGHYCPHPGTVRYGLGYYCKERIEVICVGEGVDHTGEAIHYLRHWLRKACGRANEFLEMQLSEALDKAETQLRHAQREFD